MLNRPSGHVPHTGYQEEGKEELKKKRERSLERVPVV